MKPLTATLLAGSLVLNAALVVVLALGAGQADSTPAPTLSARAKTATTPPTPIVDASTWPTLNRSDLPDLVARLRASGFPPAFVRAIVSAQLQEQYQARRKALDPDADNRPFWKSTNMDPKVQLALRQLSREQQKTLRELLGPDANPDDPFMRLQSTRQFGHLAPEKRAEAERIVREFNDLRNDLYQPLGGGSITITQAHQEKTHALERQMRAELQKLMTPAEYETYDLRGSDTASGLRSRLAAFNPTEGEFRALFQLQRAFDEQHPQVFGQLSQEQMRVRSEAQRQLNEQIKAALGPVRAAEYERATHFEYRTTSQLAARLELPPETATRAWDVREDIQKRAMQLQADRSLAPEVRTQQLAALQKEALERVTPIFGGARGAEAYKLYGGEWIQRLVPPPPRVAPPRPRG